MKRLSLLSPKRKPRASSSHLSAPSNTVSPPLCEINKDNSSDATGETSNSSVVSDRCEESSPLATIIIRNVVDSDAQASRNEKEEDAQAPSFNAVLSKMMAMLCGESLHDSRGRGADTTGHVKDSLCDYHDSEILVVGGRLNEDGVIVNDSQDDVCENDGPYRSDGKPSIVVLSPTSSTVSSIDVPVFERVTGCGVLPPGLKKVKDFVDTEVGNCSNNFSEVTQAAKAGMNEMKHGNCLMDLTEDDSTRLKSIETESGSVYSV